MDKAVERLERAIDNQEKVLIYGDYDVDGTTSVAMMYQFLRTRLINLDYYIPDRYSEGYGISKTSILYAAEQKISLVIVLDCGIKAIEKIKMAKDLGIDFIICDHHNLDPKRLDCSYPYKELSGCGVGFKFLQAFSKRNNIPFSELAELLDLLVVSIASDIVPVTGENRVLAHFGLKKLNTSPSIGQNHHAIFRFKYGRKIGQRYCVQNRAKIKCIGADRTWQKIGGDIVSRRCKRVG